MTAPTWCVACDDRHVTGNGVVCDFCLDAGAHRCGCCGVALVWPRRSCSPECARIYWQAKALAATPRGEHGTAGGARGVGAAGASAVREGRT